MKTCAIAGCAKPTLARGWCAMHYQRWRIDGSPGDAVLRRVPGVPGRTHKACTGCHTIKPLSDFYADALKADGSRRVLDGRMSQCKACFDSANQELRRRRLYGMPLGSYDQLVVDQDGRCPICNDQTKLVVDHDHDTGRVRALLCDPCNRLLSIADESPDVLRAAAGYLETHAASAAEESA